MNVQSVLNEHKSHFLRFSLVGGASTILNYLLFYILYQFLDVFYLVSSGAGYIGGVVFGFYFNKVFTFKSRSDDYYEEGIVYFALYTASLLIGLALLRILVLIGIPILTANVIVIGFTTITNYLGSKYFGRVAKRSRLCRWYSQLRGHS